MSFVFGLISFALTIFLLTLWARFVIELISLSNRSWRPQGAILVAVEICFMITDPPVRFFRRFLPQVSLGPIHLDLGWTATLISTLIAIPLVNFLADSV